MFCPSESLKQSSLNCSIHHLMLTQHVLSFKARHETAKHTTNMTLFLCSKDGGRTDSRFLANSRSVIALFKISFRAMKHAAAWLHFQDFEVSRTTTCLRATCSGSLPPDVIFKSPLTSMFSDMFRHVITMLSQSQSTSARNTAGQNKWKSNETVGGSIQIIYGSESTNNTLWKYSVMLRTWKRLLQSKHVVKLEKVLKVIRVKVLRWVKCLLWHFFCSLWSYEITVTPAFTSQQDFPVGVLSLSSFSTIFHQTATNNSFYSEWVCWFFSPSSHWLFAVWRNVITMSQSPKWLLHYVCLVQPAVRSSTWSQTHSQHLHETIWMNHNDLKYQTTNFLSTNFNLLLNPYSCTCIKYWAVSF